MNSIFKTHCQFKPRYLLLLLLAFGLSAHACADGPRGKMFESLNLSAEQEMALKDLRESKHDNFRQQRGSHKDVQTLMDQGQVDAAADLAAENARKRVHAKAEFQNRLAEILTPEQLEQWKANKKERHRQHKKHRKMLSE